jgi:hypothetical protein
MPSQIKMTLERIRQLRTEAEKLQDELNDDIEAMIAEGLVASRGDEDPDKAIGKYVQGLFDGAITSGAAVRECLPCTRDLTHRAITARLKYSPLMIQLDSKDQFGLTQFKRINPSAQIAQIAAPMEQAL